MADEAWPKSTWRSGDCSLSVTRRRGRCRYMQVMGVSVGWGLHVGGGVVVMVPPG